MSRGARRAILLTTLAGLLLLARTAAAIWAVTIQTVPARPLLPRWDHAAHLLNGWTDAHYLVTLQPLRLVWDLWGQGYWPPGHALFQVPFYALLGGGMTSGLLSSLAAFVLLGLVAVVLLASERLPSSPLSSALVLLFLTTSPFVLAYASVAMMEMLGLLTHALVFLCYAHYRRVRTSAAASAFALSLTITFFTKYNYAVLIGLPLLWHEYLQHTAGQTLRTRLARAGARVRTVVSTPTGAIVVAFAVLALTVELTGGFAFDLGPTRVAFRTIGYSAHPVLYALLLRLWYLHRRGRIPWARLHALDPRVRPLLLWFVLPVTVWLASPYPNHIKDVVNLLINTPMGPPTAAQGLVAYLRAASTDYFATSWVLGLALAGFAGAAATYRVQPPLVQVCVLAAALEFALVTLHPTRDARFLALAMLPLWLASARQLGMWVATRGPIAVTAVTVLALAAGVAAPVAVIARAPFRRLAVEHYVESPALQDALAAIRDAIGPGDTVAVLGRSDALSPALFRWQLGPPAGGTAFPVEVSRVADVAQLNEVDVVVVASPIDDRTGPAELVQQRARHDGWLQPRIDRGDLMLDRDWPVPVLGARVSLYRRPRRH